MIGIDISDRSIKVVQLANDVSHRLLAHCVLSLPGGAVTNGIVVDSTQVQSTLQAALRAAGISSKTKDPVVASIPETQSFLRVIEIPQMDEEEIAEAIKWEIVQHIPFGLENVYVDWQPLIGEGHVDRGTKLEVQVGVEQKKVVDSLYNALHTLQLDLAAFELESQALVRSLISPDMRNKQGILLVDLGDSVTDVVIHDHGAMRFSATLQKGIDYLAATLEADAGAELRGDPMAVSEENKQQLAELLLPALEELVIEINGVVEFYNSIDTKHIVREIKLTGGGSNIPGLNTAFLKHFDDVHIQQGNPWVNILSHAASARPPMNLRESVRYTTALGLALRQVLR